MFHITDKDPGQDVQVLVSLDTSDVCNIYREEHIVTAGQQVEAKDTRVEFSSIVVQDEGIVVTEESPRSLSPDIQWSASTGLMAPEIHIQAASPTPMAMSDQEEETFVPQKFSDAPPAEEASSEDYAVRGDIKGVEVDEETDRLKHGQEIPLPSHKPLGQTVSLEAQRDSQPPSDVDSQGESHGEDSERPLSPTDYILEPEGEVEGRIASDTSQQIFIEQSIEAAREHALQEEQGDRPPSPSDFTLMTESQELVFARQEIEQEPLHDAHSPGTNQTHASTRF